MLEFSHTGGSVSRIVQSNFPKIIQGIKYLMPRPTGIYYKHLQTKYGDSIDSFHGSYLCGPTSFMVKQLLDKNGIPHKVMMTSHGQLHGDEFITDHSYIKLETGEILDPTIRQFLIDTSLKSQSSEYLDYLVSLPPFFIGNEKDLGVFLNQINTKYRLSNFSTLFNNIPRTMNHWIGQPKDISDKYSLDNFHRMYQDDRNYKKIIDLLTKL